MDKNQNLSQSNIPSVNNDLMETMKQSFEYWHKIYDDSPINIPLVWKKGIESNSEILKKIEEVWKNNMKQNAEIQMQQFLESWSYAIRNSSFEIAKNSMQEWQEFWKNTTDAQFKIYAEVLEMLGTYWKNIQDKNIE